MLPFWAERLWQAGRRALYANLVLLSYTTAAWAHDTGAFHIHPPDLGSVKSPTGMLLAGVVAVLMFGFFGACAVMLLFDLIREWRERRERARMERAQAASAGSEVQEEERVSGGR